MTRLFLTLALLFPVMLFAQGTWGPSGIPRDEKNVYLELIGGINVPSLIYAVTPANTVTQDFQLTHTEGLAIRRQISNVFSVSGVATYKTQGARVETADNFYLTANYLNFYVPFEFSCSLVNKSKKACSRAFIFFGPYVAYNIGGEMGFGESKYELDENGINTIDYGTEAGLGFRFPIFSLSGRNNLSLKLSYARGMANTFPEDLSSFTKDEMSALMLSGNGSRMNQGFKFTISYELSMKKGRVTTFTAGGDGKRTYKKFVNIR